MPLYETLASAYDELFPVNPATLDFLEGLQPLPPEPGAARRLLDLGSATGGHALALARRGWRATGLEPSGAMVKLAAEAAEAAGLEARFIEAGMEEIGGLFGPASFELILCLGNTLPHLKSPEALQDFLRAARSLLKPSGSLVLQLLNYGRKLAGTTLPEIEGPRFSLSRRYREEGAGTGPGAREPGFLIFETELREKGGSPHRDETRLLAIRPERLTEALAAAGFATQRAVADWEGGPFSERENPFLILVAGA